MVFISILDEVTTACEQQKAPSKILSKYLYSTLDKKWIFVNCFSRGARHRLSSHIRERESIQAANVRSNIFRIFSFSFAFIFGYNAHICRNVLFFRNEKVLMISDFIGDNASQKY